MWWWQQPKIRTTWEQPSMQWVQWGSWWPWQERNFNPEWNN
jgi:hypothetical protein